MSTDAPAPEPKLTICLSCGGRGEVIDNDPYADTKLWVGCQSCNGTGWRKKLVVEIPETAKPEDKQ